MKRSALFVSNKQTLASSVTSARTVVFCGCTWCVKFLLSQDVAFLSILFPTSCVSIFLLPRKLRVCKSLLSSLFSSDLTLARGKSLQIMYTHNSPSMEQQRVNLIIWVSSMPLLNYQHVGKCCKKMPRLCPQLPRFTLEVTTHVPKFEISWIHHESSLKKMLAVAAGIQEWQFSTKRPWKHRGRNSAMSQLFMRAALKTWAGIQQCCNSLFLMANR